MRTPDPEHETAFSVTRLIHLAHLPGGDTPLPQQGNEQAADVGQGGLQESAERLFQQRCNSTIWH